MALMVFVSSLSAEEVAFRDDQALHFIMDTMLEITRYLSFSSFRKTLVLRPPQECSWLFITTN